MPNPNYVAGRAAEYAVMRDLTQVGFVCIRAAASHGVYDVAGVREDSAVFVQVKRGKQKPSPAEYAGLVAMPVPANTSKMVVFFPAGLTAARVIYCGGPLPDWCGFVRWLEGMPPKQQKFRGF